MRMRQSRFYPDRQKGSRLQLQPRDLQLLAQLQEDQFLTISEIQKLFFCPERGYPAAVRRLRGLWNAEVVAKFSLPTTIQFGSSPAIYAPTKKGIDLLIEQGQLAPEEVNWRNKHNHVTGDKKLHELAVNRFKVALIAALAERYELFITESYIGRDGSKAVSKRIDMAKIDEVAYFDKGISIWDKVSNPEVKAKDESIPVRPDSFISLCLDGIYKNFFLEVDRTHKSRGRCHRRLIGYKIYYQSGGFLKKYGEGEEVQAYPFVVLTTVPMEERRNNLVEMAIEAKCFKQCWFGVYDEVVADPLGSVWIRGEEYNSALSELADRELALLYKSHRRIERDKFVKSHVKKLSLLEA